VDMKLEVVVIPVSDVDRPKEFYKALGWREDADFASSADFRVVQLTPPGSPCSIIFGTGVSSAEPGSMQGLQLTVSDIDQARAGSGAPELRFVRFVQRPGRRRLPDPGDHHPAAGPLT
jgi:catechol 2,3-dioxygenase-like lactoylglutathione lyase family enzyme